MNAAQRRMSEKRLIVGETKVECRGGAEWSVALEGEGEEGAAVTGGGEAAGGGVHVCVSLP